MSSALPDEQTEVAAAAPALPAPGVKPRPRLFAVLCILFAAWIGVLVWLYVRTVYPVRHPPSERGATL